MLEYSLLYLDSCDNKDRGDEVISHTTSFHSCSLTLCPYCFKVYWSTWMGDGVEGTADNTGNCSLHPIQRRKQMMGSEVIDFHISPPLRKRNMEISQQTSHTCRSFTLTLPSWGEEEWWLTTQLGKTGYSVKSESSWTEDILKDDAFAVPPHQKNIVS